MVRCRGTLLLRGERGAEPWGGVQDAVGLPASLESPGVLTLHAAGAAPRALVLPCPSVPRVPVLPAPRCAGSCRCRCIRLGFGSIWPLNLAAFPVTILNAGAVVTGKGSACLPGQPDGSGGSWPCPGPGAAPCPVWAGHGSQVAGGAGGETEAGPGGPHGLVGLESGSFAKLRSRGAAQLTVPVGKASVAALCSPLMFKRLFSVSHFLSCCPTIQGKW